MKWVLAILVLFSVKIVLSQTCIEDPTQAKCADYTISTGTLNTYIGDVCEDSDSIVGCTVNTICKSTYLSNYCTPFSVYKDICTDVSNVTECADYNSMCTVSSVVAQCNTTVPGLPTTAQAIEYIDQICNTAACTACLANTDNCDVLSTYSSACKADPSQSACSTWVSYCNKVSDWPVCYNTTCLIAPDVASCASYELPLATINADIIDLCYAMPYMIGCTIDNTCKKYNATEQEVCERFSILKDLCIDMPMMSGCKRYNMLCPSSSQVSQCDTYAPKLPTTMQTNGYISSICGQMTMDGCDECINDLDNCDLLTTYANLCKSMPDMNQCAAWKTLCENEDLASWDICKTSGHHNDAASLSLFSSFVVITIAALFL